MVKITVMMPVYNGAQYIGEALESLKAQTFQEWELLIVDDGSTDNTMEVIDNHWDPRFRIVHQDHAGEGAARNKAIREAEGELIGFLDADDWLLPNSLADHVSYREKHPEFDVVYSDGYRCDVSGEKMSLFSETIPFHPEGDVTEYITIHPIYGGTLALTFERQLAIKNDLFFKESYRLATDWDFFIRLAEVAKFGYIDRPTCCYRIHEQSISAVNKDGRMSYHALIQWRILDQPYFADFSAESKNLFFYDMIFNSLHGKPEDQQQVFGSPQYKEQPIFIQANLLRNCASKYISALENLDWAEKWLEDSVGLDSNNFKQKMLLISLKVHPQFAQKIVHVWGKLDGN